MLSLLPFNSTSVFIVQFIAQYNFQFHHIIREDVFKILKTINSKKTTVCDQIPAKILKHASFQISPVILNIIDKSLDEGTIPNISKKYR